VPVKLFNCHYLERGQIGSSVWPPACTICGHSKMKEGLVLRISLVNDNDVSKLKVEGRLAMPWAKELERAWLTLSLGSKKLCLDIRGVTFADKDGKQILRDIFRATGAEILADSPLTKQFANEIRQAPISGAEENAHE
jgi:hypothetical protein